MNLCAVIDVRQAARVKGVEPATWIIREGELVRAALHHPEDCARHAVLQTGYIRVSVPLTMVQESLALGV